MKTKKLICPKCGNTERFRVDFEMQAVSAELNIDGEEAELDVSYPNDLDIMCPVCAVCGADASYQDIELDTPYSMCVACVDYVEGELVEVCPKKDHHPMCFSPRDIEVNLIT